MTVRLAVRLIPRGGRDALDGWATDPEGRPLLKVRVACPPVDGEANAALIQLIAKTFGLPRSAVRISAGETARIKILDIEGIEEEATMSLLPARQEGV